MIVETEAIVLHARKFRDSSKIATLFTSDFGKISVIAKGADRPKSKFGSSLDPLSYVSISFYKKNTPGLYLLASAELVKPLRKIHKNPDKLAIGLMILETVSKTMRDNQAELHHENREVFEQLLNSIIELNDLNNNELLIFVFFLLRLFKILGFEINFNGSENTNQSLKFNINNGMLISQSNGSGRIYRISKNNWELLESVYKKGINSAKSDDFNFSQIYDFLMIYIGFHLEKSFDLKSKSILMI